MAITENKRVGIPKVTPRFEDLTPQCQKMRIVDDAIAQIKMGKVVPSEGAYVRMDMSLRELEEAEGYEPFSKLMSMERTRCMACAKGSIFASCALNTGRHYTREFNCEPHIKTNLGPWFSASELDLIEAAFETRVIKDTDKVLRCGNTNRMTEIAERAVNFGERYKTPKARLLAILQNIKRYGKFTP